MTVGGVDVRLEAVIEARASLLRHLLLRLAFLAILLPVGRLRAIRRRRRGSRHLRSSPLWSGPTQLKACMDINLTQARRITRAPAPFVLGVETAANLYATGGDEGLALLDGGLGGGGLVRHRREVRHDLALQARQRSAIPTHSRVVHTSAAASASIRGECPGPAALRRLTETRSLAPKPLNALGSALPERRASAPWVACGSCERRSRPAKRGRSVG